MNDIGIANQEHETGTKQVPVLRFAHAQRRRRGQRFTVTLRKLLAA